MAVDLLAEIEVVLVEAGEPLHFGEIARRVLARGAWATRGQNPARIVNAYLSQHIRDQGEAARFRRVGRGLISLSAWYASQPHGPKLAVAPAPASLEEAQRLNAIPVALMTGEQLVALLVEHDLGVRREAQDLLEIGEAEDDGE